MVANLNVWILWTLIAINLTQETLCDSTASGCSAECEVIIVLAILTVVCIIIIIFFCIVKWKCQAYPYNPDLDNMVENESESWTGSTSVFVIETTEDDHPPNYEMGVRSETPPPSFESLFPNGMQCTSDLMGEKGSISAEKTTSEVEENSRHFPENDKN